jgi:hypothetical protein
VIDESTLCTQIPHMIHVLLSNIVLVCVPFSLDLTHSLTIHM